MWSTWRRTPASSTATPGGADADADADADAEDSGRSAVIQSTFNISIHLNGAGFVEISWKSVGINWNQLKSIGINWNKLE